MKTIKIVHTADLHLGFDYAFLGRKAAGRRAELLQTFRRIVELAQEERADLLLIAGDLFDNVRVADDLLATVCETLAQAEAHTIIVPGNHDPLSPDSPYRREGWPERVHILSGGQPPLIVEGVPARIWGAGFAGPVQRQTLLPSGADEETGDDIRLCVAHGDLVGTGQGSDYNPLTVRRLEQCGMDYVALGHIHKRGEVQRAGSVSYAYPGSPEGHGFDELGPRGVYVGTVWRGGCELSFRETGRRRFEELTVDASGVSGSLAAARLAAEAMERLGDGWEEHLYKVILAGKVAQDAHLSAELIRAELERLVYFVKLRDKTVLELPAGAETEHTLRGRFVRIMKETLKDAEEPEAAAIREAMTLGLRAFAGEVDYHAD